MKKNMMKIFTAFILCVICSIGLVESVHAANSNEITQKFTAAQTHLLQGEYNQAVQIFDEILETTPTNTKILNLKGIAQSNLGYHKQSMIQFYNVLEIDQDNVIALTGMATGFANFGEYVEGKKYIERALENKPENYVLNNYNVILQKSITKYPYTPTEKPKILEQNDTKVPNWIKNTAGWWATDAISEREFVNAIEFLVNNKIINHTISEDINFTLKTKQVLLNTEQKKSYNIIKKNLLN